MHAAGVSEPAPLLLTAGEPAGIGPDLCLALAATDAGRDIVIVSDPALLHARAAALGLQRRVTETTPADAATRRSDPGELRVVPIRFPEPPACGVLNPTNAASLLDGLGMAVAEVLAGRFRALVTGPMQKSVVNDAGIPFTGHTEYVAKACGSERAVMLLVAGELRVALATTHLPLRKVAAAINGENLRRTLEVLDADLRRRFGITAPRIAVCGLNPHAGEGGHLGHEDRDIIAPVVEALAAARMNVHGPLPADTAFTPAAGHNDAVLAMYHDQGLPVVKHAGFGHAVNVTLGLPIVRTSVDHGTALDLAGSGKADPGSLIAAGELAAELGRER